MPRDRSATEKVHDDRRRRSSAIGYCPGRVPVMSSKSRPMSTNPQAGVAFPCRNQLVTLARPGSFRAAPIAPGPTRTLCTMADTLTSPLSRRRLFIAGALGLASVASLSTIAPASAADKEWTEEFMTRSETREGFVVDDMDDWQIENTTLPHRRGQGARPRGVRHHDHAHHRDRRVLAVQLRSGRGRRFRRPVPAAPLHGLGDRRRGASQEEGRSTPSSDCPSIRRTRASRQLVADLRDLGPRGCRTGRSGLRASRTVMPSRSLPRSSSGSVMPQTWTPSPAEQAPDRAAATPTRPAADV